MSESGTSAAPASNPVPAQPAPPATVATPKAVAPEPHPLVKLFLSPDKIPGWTGYVLAAMFAFANWKGAVETYLPAVQAVSGWAAAVLSLFATPAVPMMLVLYSSFYLWAASGEDVTRGEKRAVAFMAWSLMAFFVFSFGAVMLFASFVRDSKISEMVEYMEWQTLQRRLPDDTRERLHAEFRKIGGQIAGLQVGAVRDPEAARYAWDFMSALYGAGVRLDNGPADDASPYTLDLTSLSFRGILLGVRNRQAPPPAALALADALRAAGLPFSYMNVRTERDGYLALIVGYK